MGRPQKGGSDSTSSAAKRPAREPRHALAQQHAPEQHLPLALHGALRLVAALEALTFGRVGMLQGGLS